MLWEVEIRPRHPEDDVQAQRVTAELREAGLPLSEPVTPARVYLFATESPADANRLVNQLLTDDPIETASLREVAAARREVPPQVVTVLPKPGVMDPVAESVRQVARDLGLSLTSVRTGQRWHFPPSIPAAVVKPVAETRLANDAIEQAWLGGLPDSAWSAPGSTYVFERVVVRLCEADDATLQRISRDGQLALNLAEMRTIQEHFRSLGREPTDIELETIAQTWSEHCSHKTLKGRIDYTGPDGTTRHYHNLLKETIFHATQTLRAQWGANDWCVSVFADNAGVVKFDEFFHVCFKVETHNHPSAIEPYGGANTGVGGVIRDVMGTGLGGEPICNTDVFCVAPPDTDPASLPPGVLHPRRVLRGVVAGVRDYGNRMGIPTVNGAVLFDERYLGNPLVFCGTVGLIPVGMESKRVEPGDLIVALGGRTGRDGIHGATFSSIELTHESEVVSGGAVQIGNAITQKKVLDVLLQARDQRLFRAVTDCGAGGFSSAVGEMAAECGAEVHLDRAPLKYSGLSYTEIWISEAQERMVLAVPPASWPALQQLCANEDVEAVNLGEFTATGALKLYYQGNLVGELDLHFLHEGRPPVVRAAVWQGDGSVPAPTAVVAPAPPPPESTNGHSPAAVAALTATPSPAVVDLAATLLALLRTPTVRSKAEIIRQYDHEVRGGTVLKPLVGTRHQGPGDAAVIAPVLGKRRALAVGCGINPRFGDLDPYWMAAGAVDEALRNVVAVGADPSRVALLDNFCWGNTDRPETLGSLVRAAEGCRDAALAFGAPFISGKDSLKNEFHHGDRHWIIPGTLLISALGQVPDLTRCTTMDLKRPGNRLYLVGWTDHELGGSHFHLVTGQRGGAVPKVDFAVAPEILRRLHQARENNYLVACHDLSEGGLAVALAEMAIGGNLGLVIDAGLCSVRDGAVLDYATLLFSESHTRFLLEVPFEWSRVLENLFAGLPLAHLGKVTDLPRLSVFGSRTNELLIDLSVDDLRTAWQEPLL